MLENVPGRLLSKWLRLAVAFAVIAAVVAACSDDNDQRRFANEQIETETPGPTETQGSRPTAAATEAPASPIPVGELTAGDGQTELGAFAVGSAIYGISAADGQLKMLWSESQGVVKTWRLSPSGKLLAVLTDDGVIVLDIAGGSRMAQAELPPAPEGSPVADSAGRDAISWAPDERAVAIASASGGIFSVAIDGTVSTLVEADRATAPIDVAFSPNGAAIAFANRDSSRSTGSISVAPLGRLPLDPVQLISVSSDGRRTVGHIGWSGDSDRILYTMISVSGDLSQGGDLFAIPASGGTPMLVMSASKAGPVSVIANFTVSPSGSRIAVTISVPNDEGIGTVQSLWAKASASPDLVRLPIPATETLESAWWSPWGLAWVTSTGDAADPVITLYRTDQTGTATPISHAPLHPKATPEASPVAQ
jgi:hypothetical protein